MPAPARIGFIVVAAAIGLSLAAWQMLERGMPRHIIIASLAAGAVMVFVVTLIVFKKQAR